MGSYSGYESNKDKIDDLINQVLPKEAPKAKNNIVHASKSIEKKNGVAVYTYCGLGDGYMVRTLNDYPFLNLTNSQPKVTCKRCLATIKKLQCNQ